MHIAFSYPVPILLSLFLFISVTARSQDLWSVTGSDDLVITDGILEVPTPLDPSDFEVSNKYGTTIPNQDGTFQLPVQRIGATVTAAVPATYTEGDNAWVSVVCRFPETRPATAPMILINGESTARSMILLHPFFLSPDPYRLDEVQTKMDNMSSLNDLASQVNSVWPDDTTPLDNVDVVSDLNALFDDVLDGLSQSTKLDTAIAVSSQSIESRGYRLERHHLQKYADKLKSGEKVVERSASPRIISTQLDPILQSSLEFDDSEPQKVSVSSSVGNPLDTIHRISQVDPNGTHSFRRSDSTVSTFTITSREEAFSIRNRSGGLGDDAQFALFSGAGFSDLAAGEADSLFGYLDFIDLIATAITDAIGLGTGPSNESDLPDIEDAVYVNYVFTGKLNSGTDKGEFLYAWNNHRTEVISALCLNLLNGSLDAISVLVELDDVIGPCAGTVITGAIQDANAALNFPSEDTPQNTYGVVFGIGSTALNVLATCAIEEATDKPVKALLSLSKSLLNAVNVVQKVSAIGSVVDRAVGLSGFPIGPSPTTLFTTPMDTRLIVMGDPWGPRIISVNGENPESPSAPLATIECGGELTVRGKRLQASGSIEEPSIFIRDRNGNSVRATITSFDAAADSEDPPTQVITATLPEGVAEIIRIRITNRAGAYETPDLLEIPPVLQSVESNIYFKPESGNIIGDTFIINGKGFNPSVHQVLIGDELVTPEESGSSEKMLTVIPPADLSVGLHEIRIRWRNPGDDVAGDAEAQYVRVLGKPVIDVDPGYMVIGSGTLTINGQNFGTNMTNTTVKTRRADQMSSVPEDIYNIVDIGTLGSDQLSQMLFDVSAQYIDDNPDTPEPDPVTLVAIVTTPAGESDPVEFTLTGTGSTTYLRRMQVPDITFAEAIAFANQGDSAPEGEIEVTWECLGTTTCGVDGEGDPLVVDDGVCVVNYPDDWGMPQSIDPFGSESEPNGVSPPPGFPAAVGTPCNACDTVGEVCIQPRPDLITWEGVPAADIFDDIDLDPGSMEVSLSSLPILNGPGVFISHVNTPFARFVGGGLVIEGDGIDDTVPRNITLNIKVEEALGEVITVRNCNGVFLTLQIEGEGALTGLRIENSKNVTGFLEASTMANGLVLKDSFDCDFRVELADYDTGVLVDGGGRNQITGSVGWIRTDTAIDISPMQGVGVHLKGGTTDNIIDVNLVGNMTAGIMIEDAIGNFINSSPYGVISFGGFGSEDDDGTSARNTAGIIIKPGAEDNLIEGGSFLNNDIGIVIEGGARNTITSSAFGIESEPLLMNGVDIDLRGSLTNQPSRNVIRECSFRNPMANSILLDGVTEPNTIVDCFFTSENLLMPMKTKDKGMPPPMEPVAIRAVNGTRNLIIDDNWFDQTITGISIENSSDIILTENLFTRTDAIGVQALASHSLTFLGERICGSVYNPDTETCFAGFNTQIGMLFSGCSNLRFNDVRVEALGGDGMMFVDPPTEIRGLTRIVSPRVGDTSVVVPAPRADGFAPLLEPPSERSSGTEAVRVLNNLGKGIVIRDGASNISMLGLLVSGNSQEGILIDNPGENISIEQSSITFNLMDGIHLIDVDDEDVQIGTPGNGNQLSANNGWGVKVLDSSGPVIKSNFIVFNGQNSGDTIGGICIEGSDDIQIGGSGLNDPNLISANRREGILIHELPALPGLPRYRIEGNFIGTDLRGLAPESGTLANTDAGIVVLGDVNMPDIDLRVSNNLVGGNLNEGIRIQQIGSIIGPIIEGNIIGEDSSRNVGIANVGNGIELLDANVTSMLSNWIVNNTANGISLDSGDLNLIAGNTVEGNNASGIRIFNDSDDNTVQNNPSISNNTSTGVLIEGTSDGNLISRNSITGHTGKGITLTGNGNDSVPAPTVTGSGTTSGGRPIYFGEADLSLPDFSVVELFVDDANEGQTFLASTDLINSRFSFFGVRVPAGVSINGREITATITDLDGNTSEFGIFDPSITPRDPFFPPLEPDVLISATKDGTIIQTRTTDAGSEVPLSNGPDDSFSAASELLSPNEFIFTRNIGGNDEIFRSSSSGEVNLTNNPAIDHQPSISNDGTRIAFVSERSGMPAIWLMDLNGSNPIQLTSGSTTISHPDWSPDDSEIVYASDELGTLQIHAIDVDSQIGVSIPITSLSGINDHPTWNVMTNIIAFEHAEGTLENPGNYQIGIIDPDSQIVRLFTNGSWSDQDPEWVVDEEEGMSWIIVSSRDTADQTSLNALYVMTDRGALQSQITSPEATSEYLDPACCFQEPTMNISALGSRY